MGDPRIGVLGRVASVWRVSEFEESDPSVAAEPIDDSGDVLTEEPTAVDLDAIAADLADVEIAMARLQNGTYWTDEVTGEPLPDSLLAEHPIARRLPLA